MSKETLSTSEKEVPKHKNALEEKYKTLEEKEPLNPENIQEQVSQLPVPSGWRLLVLPFTPREKTKGGILIAIAKKYKLPIIALGLGEKEDDLQIFEAKKFADAFISTN